MFANGPAIVLPERFCPKISVSKVIALPSGFSYFCSDSNAGSRLSVFKISRFASGIIPYLYIAIYQCKFTSFLPYAFTQTKKR